MGGTFKGKITVRVSIIVTSLEAACLSRAFSAPSKTKQLLRGFGSRHEKSAEVAAKK